MSKTKYLFLLRAFEFNAVIHHNSHYYERQGIFKK